MGCMNCGALIGKMEDMEKEIDALKVALDAVIADNKAMREHVPSKAQQVQQDG